MRVLVPHLTALLLLAACNPAVEEPAPLPARDAPTSPDAPGPYAVGTTTHTFTDARGVELTVEIWYPALPETDAAPSDYGQLSLARNAYRDAAPDLRDEPFPLVAFSHGYGGIRYQSTFLTEHLASHGFVVVAPDHPHNTLFDLDADLTDQVALARPGDITAAVDEVARLAVDDPRFAELVDAAQFAMVGHSFGGWTTLAVSGGLVDLDATTAHCEEEPTASCRFLDLSGSPDTSSTQPDPRVATMVSLAPGGAYTFAAGSLHSAPSPMVIGGGLDGDMPYDTEIRPAFDALGPGATMVTYARSGHWAFTDLCDLLDVLEDCQGEPEGYMEPLAIQQLTNTLVTAHLQRHLLATSAATDVSDPWLSPSTWDAEDDVTLEVAP